MREIKFRQFIKNTGKFHYWSSIAPPLGPMDDDPRESEQYTGLKDKNGKQIYEGDIARFKDCLHGRIQTGVVTFELDQQSMTSGFKLSHLSRDDDWILHMDSTDWLEVIGNIHENPELLEPTPKEGLKG